MRVKDDVALGPLTTLKLGGAAARWVDVTSDDDAREAVELARASRDGLFVLGGGSNLVVADEGYAGLVARMASRGIEATREGARVVVDVAAGESWEALVGTSVDEGWSGLECLSGIPGLVGATPIQNVGAYGQEVCDTVVHVRALDRDSGAIVTLDNAACGFSYRHSHFKASQRYIVLGVRFALTASPLSQPIRYAELTRALACAAGEGAPLAEVRRTVIALRRGKGMVVDGSDPDSVSAGSFFTNPLVDAAALAAFDARVAASGVLAPGDSAPRFPGTNGLTKLSAGWLVERAGFVRGYGDGRVGVSRKHALALVNRGGGTTRELLGLARVIREGVYARFGITLVAEPVLLGTAW